MCLPPDRRPKRDRGVQKGISLGQVRSEWAKLKIDQIVGKSVIFNGPLTRTCPSEIRPLMAISSGFESGHVKRA